MSAANQPMPARRPGKRASAFRTIGEVAADLDVPTHVLRFWEAKFPQLRPLKRAGGRRYYRPDDVALLQRIRQCLYQDGYTIRGVQRLLSEGAAEPDLSDVADGLPEPATLFPLEPLLPEPTAAGRSGRTKPARSKPPTDRELPPAVRSALDELRRDLVEMRAVAERLRRAGGRFT